MTWFDRAACKGLDPGLFVFDPQNGGVAKANDAKKVCACCPVVDDCFEYAVADPTLIGVWGMSSVKDRQAERVRRSHQANDRSTTMESAPAPGVGTTGGELTNTEARMRGLDASADTERTSSHTPAWNQGTAA